jgi:hypothetical protein
LAKAARRRVGWPDVRRQRAVNLRRRLLGFVSVPNRPCAVQEYHSHSQTAAADACEYEANNRENKICESGPFAPAGQVWPRTKGEYIGHLSFRSLPEEKASDLVTIVDPDKDLSRQERAISNAMKRTDDDLNWVILYSRAVMPENWHEYKQALFHMLPPILRDIAATVIRRHLQRSSTGRA